MPDNDVRIARLRNALAYISNLAHNSMTRSMVINEMARIAHDALRRDDEYAAPKPHRMQANPAFIAGSPHSVEHDWNDECGYGVPCQPVEAEQPSAPDHIADAGKKVAPDPGEGWEDFPLFDDEPLMAFKDRSGETWYTYQAVALRGFMGFRYIYENGETDTFAEPCIYDQETGETLFPVAMRFRKDSK
jgi:hypothetical protein